MKHTHIHAHACAHTLMYTHTKHTQKNQTPHSGGMKALIWCLDMFWGLGFSLLTCLGMEQFPSLPSSGLLLVITGDCIIQTETREVIGSCQRSPLGKSENPSGGQDNPASLCLRAGESGSQPSYMCEDIQIPTASFLCRSVCQGSVSQLLQTKDHTMHMSFGV